MTIHVHWFLPTSGDSREIVGFGPTTGRRPADIDYLSLVAKAADQWGFEAVLTPTGTWCEDAWLTTVALAQHTERLKFLVAFRPGVISPTLAAQMAATYQRITRGRLLLNVVTGGDSAEQRRFGDHLDHDRRYARTAEFLQVLRGAWSAARTRSRARTTPWRTPPYGRPPTRCRRCSSAGPRHRPSPWRRR